MCTSRFRDISSGRDDAAGRYCYGSGPGLSTLVPVRRTGRRSCRLNSIAMISKNRDRSDDQAVLDEALPLLPMAEDTGWSAREPVRARECHSVSRGPPRVRAPKRLRIEPVLTHGHSTGSSGRGARTIGRGPVPTRRSALTRRGVRPGPIEGATGPERCRTNGIRMSRQLDPAETATGAAPADRRSYRSSRTGRRSCRPGTADRR